MQSMEIGSGVEAGLRSKGDVPNPISFNRWPALTTKPIETEFVIKSCTIPLVVPLEARILKCCLKVVPHANN